MLAEEVAKVFYFYLKKVRPAIAPKREDPTTASLFLRVRKDGKTESDKNLGAHVTRFARALGYKLSPTTFRSIVDTHAVAEHRKGNITNEQLAATFTVNGHDASTSRQFYQRYVYYYVASSYIILIIIVVIILLLLTRPSSPILLPPSSPYLQGGHAPHREHGLRGFQPDLQQRRTRQQQQQQQQQQQHPPPPAAAAAAARR